MSRTVDILIPTYNRPSALAVTLTSLIYQTFKDFNIIISDQTENYCAWEQSEVIAVLNVLRFHGYGISLHRHLPARGMAEQREFLLNQATAPYVLYLDDDLILEHYVVQNMVTAIQDEACGFVGSSVIGLSYLQDYRPHEQQIEFWEGPVRPEEVGMISPELNRIKIHNAANLIHVQEKLGLTPENPRRYKVAWVGACVLFDTEKLRNVGGFSFWDQLPEKHSGEDVLAQLRVMHAYGGCGLIPSGVYHQELPTTIEDRKVDAPKVLAITPKGLTSRNFDVDPG